MSINKTIINNSIYQVIPPGRSGIIYIFQPKLDLIGKDFVKDYKIVNVSYFDFKLYAFAQINSIDIVPLASFVLKDPVSFKEFSRKNLEVNKPRKRLNLLFIKGINSIEVGFINLINLGNDFFDNHDIFSEIEIDNNLIFSDVSIGIKLEDVGFGLLGDTDKLLICGSYAEELTLFSSDIAPVNNVNISNYGTSGSGNISNGGNDSGNTGSNQTQGLVLGNNTTMDNSYHLGN